MNDERSDETEHIRRLREHSGLVAECLTQDRGVAGSSLTGVSTGAQWLSGRVLDLRPKGRGLEPHRRHCIVSLSKNINPSLVLVQLRKTHPFITERLLMGRKESNQTNQKKTGVTMLCLSKTHNPCLVLFNPGRHIPGRHSQKIVGCDIKNQILKKYAQAHLSRSCSPLCPLLTTVLANICYSFLSVKMLFSILHHIRHTRAVQI